MANTIFYTLSESIRQISEPKVTAALSKHYQETVQSAEKKFQDDKRHAETNFEVLLSEGMKEDWIKFHDILASMQIEQAARQDDDRMEQQRHQVEQREQLLRDAAEPEARNTEDEKKDELQEQINAELERIEEELNRIEHHHALATQEIHAKLENWHAVTWKDALVTAANWLRDNIHAAGVFNLTETPDEIRSAVKKTHMAIGEKAMADPKAQKMLMNTYAEIGEILGERRCSPLETINNIPGKREEFEFRYSENINQGMPQEKAYQRAVIDTIKAEFGLNDQIAVTVKMKNFYQYLDKLSGNTFLDDKVGVSAIRMAARYAQNQDFRALTDKYLEKLIETSSKSASGDPSPHAQLAELDRVKNNLVANLNNKKQALQDLSAQPPENAASALNEITQSLNDATNVREQQTSSMKFSKSG